MRVTGLRLMDTQKECVDCGLPLDDAEGKPVKCVSCGDLICAECAMAGRTCIACLGGMEDDFDDDDDDDDLDDDGDDDAA